MEGKLGRVLVVDDEESVRNLLQRILTGVGYEVITAINGQEALVKISQMDFSAVLLDIKMPGMSGVEVLRQLNTNHPDICVVMVTAVSDAQTAVDTMKEGAYDYIIKPFTMGDVVEKMKRAVEKRALQLESERRRLELEEIVVEQAEHLRQQFTELVETLAREHQLIYGLARRKGVGKMIFSKLPRELQEPMSSAEDFGEALIRIMRKGVLKSS